MIKIQNFNNVNDKLNARIHDALVDVAAAVILARRNIGTVEVTRRQSLGARVIRNQLVEDQKRNFRDE